MDQSRFLECLRRSPSDPILHIAVHSHAHMNDDQAQKSLRSSVRRLIFSRPRPASWIRYMLKLCIVSERLSDSIAKLIINKYYCFPYKQVDRR